MTKSHLVDYHIILPQLFLEHRLNDRTVVVCYFIADYCATPSVSLDDDCSAGRPYRCAWRARSRRPHTHAKRNDKDVSQNSRRPKTRKASHNVVCQQ